MRRLGVHRSILLDLCACLYKRCKQVRCWYVLENNAPLRRSAAAEALDRQSNLPGSAITALVALFQDKDSDVRSAAAEVLVEQASLPESAITALVALLQDKDRDVRSAAAEVLGVQSSLPESAMKSVRTLLQYDDNSVRFPPELDR